MAGGDSELSPALSTSTRSFSIDGGGGRELIVGGVVSVAGGAVRYSRDFFYGGGVMDGGTSEWTEAEEAAEK